MKVHVEQQWDRDVVNIWFYDRTPEGTVYVQNEGGGVWRDEVVKEGLVRPEPTLTLHRDWLAELLREASGLIQVDAGTERHLNDALTVRDRLLTLVEDSAP